MTDMKEDSRKKCDLGGHTESDPRRLEQMLDEALEGTFPASDPISVSRPFSGSG